MRSQLLLLLGQKRGKVYFDQLQRQEYILSSFLVDQELAAKLHSELELEKDIRDSDQLPANIKSFLESSPFEVSS